MEAVEFFDRSSVLTFGLGLIPQEEGQGLRLGEVLEAHGHGIVAVLLPGDFDISDQFGLHGDEGLFAAAEDLVQATGKESAFEPGGAENALLGDGGALEREPFLRVDRLVVGEETGFEPLDLILVLHADNGEAGGVEFVII